MKLAAPARRAVALLLAGTGVFLLTLRALSAPRPYRASFSATAKFWRANPTTRLLNSPDFRDDPTFALELLRHDAELPLSRNVALVVGPEVRPEEAERLRRKAAYLLAPRHVPLVRGPVSGWRLLPLSIPSGTSQ